MAMSSSVPSLLLLICAGLLYAYCMNCIIASVMSGRTAAERGLFPHTPLDLSESSAGDEDGAVTAHVVRRRKCRQAAPLEEMSCGVISIIG